MFLKKMVFLIYFIYFIVVVFKILIIWEREREWSGRGEEDRESEADSTLRAEPDAGLDLTSLRAPLELKPRVGHSTDRATGVPEKNVF